MKYKRIILLISISILFFGIYKGVKLYNKTYINIQEEAPESSLRSQELVEEFKKNEDEANKKYLGKIIQISGKIVDFGVSKKSKTIVLNDKIATNNVLCDLYFTENKKWILLKKGQNIVVKGICTGYLLDVVLINCVIINK